MLTRHVETSSELDRLVLDPHPAEHVGHLTVEAFRLVALPLQLCKLVAESLKLAGVSLASRCSSQVLEAMFLAEGGEPSAELVAVVAVGLVGEAEGLAETLDLGAELLAFASELDQSLSLLID